MTATLTHSLIPTRWPGSHGDRPEPWQVTYSCTCGVGFEPFDEEGRPPIDRDALLDEHIREVS